MADERAARRLARGPDRRRGRRRRRARSGDSHLRAPDRRPARHLPHAAADRGPDRRHRASCSGGSRRADRPSPDRTRPWRSTPGVDRGCDAAGRWPGVADAGARGPRRRALRRPHRRRRDRRRRGAARRDEPRAPRGARRAARHRVGHVRPVSSRLIHGGLRYLEQLHFGLVYEALEERARLLRLAPHLVTLEPFLFPIYGIPLLHQGFYGSGIFLYDLLGAAARRRLREAPAAVERDRVRAGPAAQGPDRRDHLPRRGRGRRPAGARGAPDGASRAAPSRRPASAPRSRCSTASGSSARRCATSSSDDQFEIRAERVIDATGVWAADPEARFADARGRRPLRPEPRLAHRHPPRPPPGAGRAHASDPGPRRVHHPVAGPLDHRHDRPLRTRARRSSVSAPEADVDELLDDRQPAARHRPRRRATSSARTRACGRSSATPAARP